MRKLFSMLAAMIFCSVSASAQSDLELWFSPRIGDDDLTIKSEWKTYGSADAEDGAGDITLNRYQIHLSQPFARAEQQEWYVSFDYENLSLGGDKLHLKESGDPVPRELHDISAGLTYRRILNRGWVAGGHLQLGAAGDGFFPDNDSSYLRGAAFLSIPQSRARAWIFMLYGDSNLDFPVVPGVGYRFPLSQKTWAVLGVPFLMVNGAVGERTSYQVSCFGPWSAKAELRYAVSDALSLYGRYSWDASKYKREDREHRDDVFDYEEMRTAAGFDWAAHDHILVGGAAGYAFNRAFGEGDDRSDRRNNEIEVDDAWFGQLVLKLHW
jgi:hypothetical protein